MNDYSKVWGKYHVYASERKGNCSEELVLSLVLSKFRVESMVDFGCAIGRWCKAGKNLGIQEVLGIDGKYVDEDSLVIDKSEFLRADLGEKIQLPKRYDLAISLEVAEHLPEEKSDLFVENLTCASDVILFSAAIRGQGGDFHVNEQPLSYWRKKFEERGYCLCDCLRPVIWENDCILPMYRQNCVFFIEKNVCHEKCTEENNTIIDVVHPKVYENVAYGGVMLFPFHSVEKDSKIVLYGGGTVGKQYYSQLQATGYCKEVIWVDKERTQACVENRTIKINSLDILEQTEVDYYVVAVENKDVVREIIEDLKNRGGGIRQNKIIYEMIRITRF